MSKIRVSDLAKKMGIPTQDLVFKLKSIGVRLDEDDPQVDTDVFQAILQGKKLPQPREVILRDAETPAPQRAPRRPPPGRRLPGPARPHHRRRTMIQRVEPRIRTIPTAEKPKPAPAAPAAASAGTTAPPVEPTVAPPADTAVATAPPAVAEPTVATAPAAVPTAPAESESRQQRRVKRRRTAGTTNVDFKGEPPSAPVTVAEGMTVREFAEKLGVKSKDLIRVLMGQGLMVTINHVLDPDTAVEIAEQIGVEATAVTFEEEVQLQQEEARTPSEGDETRAPIVTIMGHVDHGKTTLLDAIRSSRVTETEFGGITQHIGAYEVSRKGKKIVFVDTPGHEAFTMMRARGARVTDIVVLVVAADDGVMPQTREAIDHSRAAGVPIVVAINKVDKANANLDKVRNELAENGLAPEDWGGDTVAVEVSALKGKGVDELLEMILLTAEIQELKADAELPAHGVVLEARKEAGRGVVATVLVQDGSLAVGDVFVSGASWGKVRTMTNDVGHRVTEVEPATPVEVSGFNGVPEAGETFQVVGEESKARSIAELRLADQRRRELSASPSGLSLEQLFSRIGDGDVKELNLILKADVQGSVEVLNDTLKKLSTDRVKIQVIRSGVGAVTTNDVLLAQASEAIVYGFNVRPERNAAELADKEGIDIRLHTVIYELSEELQKAMVGLLEPSYEEVALGRAEVRELFKVPKLGMVAGCHVVEGVISRNATARLLRDNRVIYEGKIVSLRRFKDDASKVRSGYDCGIRLDGFQDLKPGDFVEAYGQKEIAPTL